MCKPVLKHVHYSSLKKTAVSHLGSEIYCRSVIVWANGGSLVVRCVCEYIKMFLMWFGGQMQMGCHRCHQNCTVLQCPNCFLYSICAALTSQALSLKVYNNATKMTILKYFNSFLILVTLKCIFKKQQFVRSIF